LSPTPRLLLFFFFFCVAAGCVPLSLGGCRDSPCAGLHPPLTPATHSVCSPRRRSFRASALLKRVFEIRVSLDLDLVISLAGRRFCTRRNLGEFWCPRPRLRRDLIFTAPRSTHTDVVLPSRMYCFWVSGSFRWFFISV